MSNMQEMKARGGTIVMVVEEGAEDEVGDVTIRPSVPEREHYGRPGLHAAFEPGCILTVGRQAGFRRRNNRARDALACGIEAPHACAIQRR